MSRRPRTRPAAAARRGASRRGRPGRLAAAVPLLAVALVIAATAPGRAAAAESAGDPRRAQEQERLRDERAEPRAPDAGFAGARPRTTLIVLLPVRGRPGEPIPGAAELRASLGDRSYALGALGANQGAADPAQAVLDLSSGARTSRSTYRPRAVPPWSVAPEGAAGRVRGWGRLAARAARAPQTVAPGRLGGRGATFVGTPENARLGLLAADEGGRIARLSLGGPATVAARARLLRQQALARGGREVLAPTVVALPPGGGDAVYPLTSPGGGVDPGEFRGPAERIVVGIPADGLRSRLWPVAVVTGPGRPQVRRGDDPATVTSATTRLRGLVTALDVVPTVARAARRPVPGGVTGRPIEVVDDQVGVGTLTALAARLEVVAARRGPVLAAVAVAWALLLAGGAAVARRRGLRWAARTGALAALWAPAVLLLGSALRPGSALAEGLLTAGACVALGVVSDRLLRWPRAPLLPGAVGVLAYTADLAAGSPLIVGSVLGPNPLSGSRFYGLGNELEATLPVLALLALAGALAARPRSWRLAGAVALTGALLVAVTGAGRLGADVGGVFTVGGGFAAATLAALPGRLTRRRVAVAVAAPVLGLVALAGLDLATAGDGHFTRFVLEAGEPQELADTARRRLGLALRTLLDPAVAALTAVALAALVVGWRRRGRLLAGLREAAAWRAALVGAAAAGVAGALTNDSGPLLLLFAVGFAAAGVAYLVGRPERWPSPAGPPPRT